MTTSIQPPLFTQLVKEARRDLKKDDIESARQKLEKAISSNIQDESTLLARENLAQIYEDLGEKEKAKDNYEKILTLFPEHSPKIVHRLGKVLEDLNQRPAAEKYYQIAIELHDQVNSLDPPTLDKVLNAYFRIKSPKETLPFVINKFQANKIDEAKALFHRISLFHKDAEHAIYRHMWEIMGKPYGDPEFGRHSFRDLYGLSSTTDDKIEAINRYLKY